MDSRHRGAARTAGTGRGDVYFCMQPAEPSQRGPPRLHRVGKCSLFRFTDFIRQFRAGCTHHCVGGEPIRTVPPLRVVIDIAGQTPRSAPRRCRLTVSLARASAYVWTYHPFPRRRGATVVLACQAGARRARRSSGVGAREGEASRSCAGAGGAWLRCEARPCGHARVSSARRSAAGSRTKYRPAPTVSAEATEIPRKCQTMPATAPVAPPVASWQLSPAERLAGCGNGAWPGEGAGMSSPRPGR